MRSRAHPVPLTERVADSARTVEVCRMHLLFAEAVITSKEDAQQRVLLRDRYERHLAAGSLRMAERIHRRFERRAAQESPA